MEINDQRKLLDLERRIASLEAFLADRLKARSRDQELIALGREMRERPEKFQTKKGGSK